MRILTLRGVLVRRISHPRDCLFECVPKVIFGQGTTNELKNQFKFNALRRDHPSRAGVLPNMSSGDAAV